MSKYQELLQKLPEVPQLVETFFRETLWEYQEEELTKTQLFLIRLIKIIYISIKGLADRDFLTLASSLTFSTTLSLVPLLALSFALAKGFGVQEMLQPLILSKAMGNVAEDLVPKIMEYVEKTNVKPLGSIGLVIMIMTAINVLGKIEVSFNKIWGVKKQRTFFRRFSDYLSVLTVGPIFILAAIGISTTLSSHTVTQKLLEIGLFAGFMKVFLLTLPWLCIFFALTFLYIFIPNTKVNFLPALLAGVIAGSVWELTQYTYIYFQVGVSKYNAIYGTFASVPIFLMWVYISWVIVLVGSEISFACQNVKQLHSLDLGQEVDYHTKEKAAISIMLELCKEYEKQQSRLTAEGISWKTKLPLTFVNDVLDHLYRMGYILFVEKDREVTFVPARPTDQLKITGFFQDYKKAKGEIDFEFVESDINKIVEALLARHSTSLQSEFQKESFKDLL